MNEKLLREIEDVATASTPGPLAWGIHPATTVDEAAAWMAESIRKCPGTTVHMVVQGSPGEEIADGKVTAYTGNGPTSEANAIFYAGAREAALLLIAEVRRLREVLHEYGRHLDDCVFHLDDDSDLDAYGAAGCCTCGFYEEALKGDDASHD